VSLLKYTKDLTNQYTTQLWFIVWRYCLFLWHIQQCKHSGFVIDKVFYGRHVNHMWCAPNDGKECVCI